MFIGYVKNSVAYRFLVLKSDVLVSNTIIETKNAEFFEHIYPLFEKISHAPIDKSTTDDNGIKNTHLKELRMSKRQRKETSFGDDFYTYLVDKDLVTYFETISSSDTLLWNQ